jgi:hypothetical protein
MHSALLEHVTPKSVALASPPASLVFDMASAGTADVS